MLLQTSRLDLQASRLQTIAVDCRRLESIASPNQTTLLQTTNILLLTADASTTTHAINIANHHYIINRAYRNDMMVAAGEMSLTSLDVAADEMIGAIQMDKLPEVSYTNILQSLRFFFFTDPYVS